MTDARLRGFWSRSVLLAVPAMLAFAATTEGCSCAETGDTTSTSGNAGGGGSGGTGGTGGGTGGTGGSVVMGIAPAAQDVARPLDATPDPDGVNIYFTAIDPTKGTGVYKVPSAGGPATPVFVGDPFVSPFGIAIDGDGTQLYVADMGSSFGPADSDDAGQIFVLPIAGGNPTLLAGTAGTKPRGLEIAGDKSLYFSGRNAMGAVGVFKIPAAGGMASPVAVGAPFTDPGGVAIAKNGDVYVADMVSETTYQAVVYKIEAGTNTPKPVVASLSVGYPAGIALDMTDARLFVSGRDPATLTDVVYVIELSTSQVSLYTGDADTSIAAFEEPAGLHRAKNKNVFAWADSKAGAMGGTVFTINF